MSQQWSDFPVSHEPSSLPDTVEGGHYVRVAMTSHDLMTVWAAGPARAFRVAVPISARPPVKVTHTNPRTGQRESHFEEFTDDDQRTIDEFVNFGFSWRESRSSPAVSTGMYECPVESRMRRSLRTNFAPRIQRRTKSKR